MYIPKPPPSFVAHAPLGRLPEVEGLTAKEKQKVQQLAKDEQLHTKDPAYQALHIYRLGQRMVAMRNDPNALNSVDPPAMYFPEPPPGFVARATSRQNVGSVKGAALGRPFTSNLRGQRPDLLPILGNNTEWKPNQPQSHEVPVQSSAPAIGTGRNIDSPTASSKRPPSSTARATPLAAETVADVDIPKTARDTSREKFMNAALDAIPELVKVKGLVLNDREEVARFLARKLERAAHKEPRKYREVVMETDRRMRTEPSFVETLVRGAVKQMAENMAIVNSRKVGSGSSASKDSAAAVDISKSSAKAVDTVGEDNVRAFQRHHPSVTYPSLQHLLEREANRNQP